MDVVKITDTIARPANTTQYAAGDVLGDTPGTRLQFTGVPRCAGRGALIEAAVCIDSVFHATVRPDLELWLFDADVTATADNDAAAFTDADLLNLVGIVSFPVASFKQGGANGACVQSNLGISVKADRLYGVLVLRNTYTPASAEVFKVVLTVIR